MRDQLKRLLIERSIERRRCILACGMQSEFTIDCMPTILLPLGFELCGELMFDQCIKFIPDAVSGVELGGCPLASAVSVRSNQTVDSITALYVRKTGAVEGLRSVPSGLRVVVVDDVLATGGSLLRAVSALRVAGAVVVGAFVLVDREIGGRQAVESEGIRLVPIFTLSELVA